MAGAIQRARDEGRQEGRQEGMERGVREGRIEGERAVLERLLLRRFRRLSPGAAESLRHASANDLETWAENVLDAETLEDVFRPAN